MSRSACLVALAGALLLPSLLYAQRDLPANRTYALTNARIVVAPGRTIERGNVIVRNGRIAAVGATATIPADARVMNLAGATVYPGLIDAATSIGLPALQVEGGGQGGGGAPTQFQQAALRSGSNEPYELNADRNAADAFQARQVDLEALRAI